MYSMITMFCMLIIVSVHSTTVETPASLERWVLLQCCVISLNTRNTCKQQPLAHFTVFFYLLKYRRERFENANICISPTFQETVGSHLKPSLPVVVTATLNQFNSNLFCGFSKQYSTCKNITTHQYTYILNVASTPSWASQRLWAN